MSLTPLRYRGYVYDTEWGLYYLQSRYYDPEIGRFINADAFTSTGQGLLGNNMFAYCGNNPISRIDPTGDFWWVIPIVVVPLLLDGCSVQSDAKNKGYPSADAAAIAFSEEIYGVSYYIIHEFSSVIYSKTSNGVKTYYYTEPIPHEPHKAKVFPSPCEGTYEATIHTHPIGEDFSKGDRDTANELGVNFYVAGIEHTIFHYNGNTGETRKVGNFVPNEPSWWAREMLPYIFRGSWESHFGYGGLCIYGCESRIWPNS